MDSSEADELSMRLMSQIHSETLQQFLAPCHLESHFPVQFQIPGLDSYLSNEALPSFRRTRELSNTIEIRGPSGSGKTHLLYFLLSSCILPQKPTFGWGKAAFVFDMDGTFCVTRFCQILIARLAETTPSAEIIPLVQKCFQFVHIFRPDSSNQLDVTLKSLPKYHAKLFPHVDLGMITIHSIDAFHWLDRYKNEQAKTSTASISSKISNYHNTTSILQTLLLSFNTIGVTTYWALSSQAATTHQPDADRQGDYYASFQQRDSQYQVSKHQITLTAGKAITSTAEEPPYQEIEVFAQTINRLDSVSFKLYITRQGISVRPGS